MKPKYALLNFCMQAFIFCVNPPQAKTQAKPVSLDPENPHYFLYKNKPTVLITSGEHYGAVLNTDFDYTIYLDELQSKGLNLTRTFSGSYVEPPNAFNISKNTLAPKPGKFLCPWKRSTVPGYEGGGNKFDLSQWDQAYFKRLKDFVATARSRGVIVEFTLFCPFYGDEQWALSPMNGHNNVNDIDTMPRTYVYTLDKNHGLLAVQEKLVRKIVSELKDDDNVMYEICNEPYFGGVTIEWQHHFAEVIAEAEKDFLFKHLITQNIANGHAKIKDPFPEVSVFNFHYAWPPVTVAMNYQLNKAIGDNETGFRGNSDSSYRMEGWRFILAGGSLYNNLDYSFTAGNEKGTYHYPSTQPGGGSDSLRRQLSFLKKFIEGFDFIHLHPDSSLVSKGALPHAEATVLAQPGKQYAVYFYGTLQPSFKLHLPSGKYVLSWMDTKTGEYKNKKVVSSANGKVTVSPPAYADDIALKIMSRE
ncbi:MAG TPA: cellulase family glycosylhydrolase [Hanamia sp.]|nr:cellulase family glycosylhydrolase [Hanamia sp.]